MKKQTLLYALAVTAGFGFTAQAASPDLLRTETNRAVNVITNAKGEQITIVEDVSMPAGDVTSSAGRFPEGTEIAATGTVARKDGNSLILDRRDGQVRARISGQVDGQVAVGDVVTVYGRLTRVPEDLTQVETEAFLVKATGKSYLTDLGQERSDEMVRTGTPGKLSYHPL